MSLKERLLQLVSSRKKESSMAKAASKKSAKKKVKASKPKAKPKAAPPKKAVPIKSAAPSKAKVAKTTEKEKVAAPKKGAKPAKAAQPEKSVAPAKKPVLGPITPGRLGEKRECLKCHTKFYDFERNPIICPKCYAEFEPEDFQTKIVLKSDPKQARAAEKEEEPERELVVSDAGEDFESLEDLSDDESAVVGIGPDKESDESYD
jgi:uncharacterized protein (TIGR02300 family)